MPSTHRPDAHGSQGGTPRTEGEKIPEDGLLGPMLIARGHQLLVRRVAVRRCRGGNEVAATENFDRAVEDARNPVAEARRGIRAEAVLMGGKRRLKGGAARLRGRHDGLAGRAFRRSYDALAEEFDLSSPLARLEASRVAAAWVNVAASTRALEVARRARANGRGRRPGSRDLERASRRQGLGDASYSQALARLRELVGERRSPSLAEMLAQRKPDGA
jgi:hypothetical protein